MTPLSRPGIFFCHQLTERHRCVCLRNMKSLVFTFAVVTILSQSYLSQAQSKDSAKTIKQISDLQAKLAGLNSQLSDAKEQLRVDSTSFEAAFASSQQALMAAKDAA